MASNPNPAPFIAAARKYGSQPSFDAWARKTYGVSGPKLLAKVAKGESGFDMGAVSSAGARGGTGFMPGTRQDFIRRYGVDPWAGPDEAVHATELYLQHDPRGLAGYNPGDPSYTSYILGQKVGGLGAGTAPAPDAGRSRRTSAPTARTITKTVGGVDHTKARGALIASFLQGGDAMFTAGTAAAGAETSDPLQFALGLRQLADIPGRKVTTTTPVRGGAQPRSAPVSGGYLSRIKQRANVVDSRRLPYHWGGGHGGKVAALKQAVPVDCSGAVSEVLGINPRVAAQFETFGKPGAGGNRGVTIYAKSTHVLMKINGRFFGTSQSNPGGGAGWIPANYISPEYLKGFTARHL
jgi:hypothetical protein